MALERGKIAKPKEIVSVRELVRDDLAVLRQPRERAVISRFRDPHHRLARMFAAGLRVQEIVPRSGYSLARVLTIKGDPAFQELVSKYREKIDEAFVDGVADFYELATTNMLKAERQIAEKLDEADENNEFLPTKDLIAISRDAADRFGFGKKQTNVNVNVDFAAQLEKAIARSGKVIDAQTGDTSRHQGAVPALESPPAVVQPQPFRRRA